MMGRQEGATIERAAVDRVVDDVEIYPAYLAEEAGTTLLKDPRMRELGHGALTLGAKKFPGSSPEARVAFEAWLEGVAFAADVFQRQQDSNPDDGVAA